jgi:hypothetical protein
VENDKRIAVTRQVQASCSDVFRLVCDPAMHVEIDGSGMLMSAPDAKPVTAVGDTFAMLMDREPLGDVPLGKYEVTNTVTRIEPDHLLEWNVGMAPYPTIGHVYGYEITPVGDGITEVTSYCDWSNLIEKYRDVIKFPVVPVTMIEQSMDKLVALVNVGKA